MKATDGDTKKGTNQRRQKRKLTAAFWSNGEERSKLYKLCCITTLENKKFMHQEKRGNLWQQSSLTTRKKRKLTATF